MNLVFLPGLAADDRMFHNLKQDFPEAIFFNWIQPIENENLQNYVQRLVSKLAKDKEYFLVGASFGGIVAQEMSKVINTQGILIIGSLRGSDNFSFLQKLYLEAFSRKSMVNLLTLNRQSRVQKRRLSGRQGQFLRWAYGQLKNWKSSKIHIPVYHIHGTDDNVFPIDRVNPDRVVNGGSHNLLHSHPQEVKRYLGEVLRKVRC